MSGEAEVTPKGSDEAESSLEGSDELGVACLISCSAVGLLVPLPLIGGLRLCGYLVGPGITT